MKTTTTAAATKIKKTRAKATTKTETFTGYRPCGCLGCFEIALSELCHDCEDAGCEVGQRECQSSTAYGCDETEDTDEEKEEPTRFVYDLIIDEQKGITMVYCETTGYITASYPAFACGSSRKALLEAVDYCRQCSLTLSKKAQADLNARKVDCTGLVFDAG